MRIRGHSRSLIRLLSKAGIVPKRGAEIGVLKGGTSRALLFACRKLHLTMVDAWTPPECDSAYVRSRDPAARLSVDEQQHNFEEAFRNTQFAVERRTICRKRSVDAAEDVPDESLDFAFIDADHSYEGCSKDIAAWWPKIRPGGVLTGHDYGARADRLGLWGVSRAVDEFSTERRLEVKTWPGRVWAVHKPGRGNLEGSATPPTIKKASPQFVRVLFGDLEAHPKLKYEVRIASRHAWSREEVVHFVLGTKNYDYLKRLGVKDVRLVNERDQIVPRGMPRLGNKPYLLRHAMEHFDEILFVDFDCKVMKVPDAGMWHSLRSRSDSAQRTFQALNVGYKRRVVPTLKLTRNVSRRRLLNSALVYCSDRSWLDRWISAFEELAAKGIQLTVDGNDEVPLIYSIYKQCGPLDSSKLVAAFEIPIGWLTRGTPEAKALKSSEHIYFSHR